MDVGRTAVFGIGWAGCKIVQAMSGELSGEVIPIAVDSDKALLDSISGDVIKIHAGDVKDSPEEEIKRAISENVSGLDGLLDDVVIAVEVVDLSKNSGLYASEFISSECKKKGILALCVLLPKKDEKWPGNDMLKSAVAGMRKGLGGVVICSMQESQLPQLLNPLIESASAEGGSLGFEGLKSFFEGGLFLVSSGGGKNLDEALGTAIEAAAAQGTLQAKKVLCVLGAPSEIEVFEMKRLNGLIQERLNPDVTRWVTTGSKGGSIFAFLISSIEWPPGPEKSTRVEQAIVSTREVARPVEAVSAPPAKPPEHAIVKPFEHQVTTPEVIIEVPARHDAARPVEQPPLKPTEHQAAHKQTETEHTEQIAGIPVVGQDPLPHVREQQEKRTNLDIDLGGEESEDEKLLGESIEKFQNLWRPALKGLDKSVIVRREPVVQKPKPVARIGYEKRAPEESEGDLLEDAINEISGTPSFKRMGRGPVW